jgi:hypothetical protein
MQRLVSFAFPTVLWAALLCNAATIWPAAAAAQVVLDQWGTNTVVASSDCADFCDPDVDLSWLLGLSIEPAIGGATIDISDSTLDNSKGNAFSEASVLAVLAPVIRVDANSLAGGWVDGTGTAVQGYTYVGVAADTIDVSVQLTGTIGNPDGDPSTGLAAQVSYVGDANVASLVFENAVLGLVIPDGAVQLEQTADGVVSQADVLSIPVSPGDQFYLVASSAATAGGPNAFAESLGTLSIQFDAGDAANLEVAGAPPAVPSLAWPAGVLLVLVLTALGLRHRP